jgi:hypothetical protein
LGFDTPSLAVPPQKSSLKIGDSYVPYKAFLAVNLPLSLVPYKGISDGAKVLFARLLMYAGKNRQCWPSVKTLARECEVSTDTIGRRLKELVDEKFIARQRRRRGNSVCTFPWHTALESSLRPAPSEVLETANLRSGYKEEKNHHHQKNQIHSYESKPKAPAEVEGNPRPKPSTEGAKELATKGRDRRLERESPDAETCDRLLQPVRTAAQATKAMTTSQPAGNQPDCTPPADSLEVHVKTQTGDVLTVQVIDWIKARLENRRVPMTEFLTVVKRHNLAGARNLPGLLTHVATTVYSARAIAIPEAANPANKPRVCEFGRCGGCGYTAISRAGVEYCSCASGKDLEERSRRADLRRSLAQPLAPTLEILAC